MPVRLSGDTLAKIALFLILGSPIITYSLSETVLTRWPFAASFSDFVARYIPAIDKLTALSQFPQVTRLFMALLWGIVVPVFLALALLTKPQTNHLRRMKAPEWAIWTAPLIVVSVCWMIIYLPFVEADKRVNIRCDFTPFYEGICLVSDSRFWLGIFGTAFAVVMVISIVAMIHWPKAICTYYSNKAN